MIIKSVNRPKVITRKIMIILSILITLPSLGSA
jgi:hypothetical protein